MLGFALPSISDVDMIYGDDAQELSVAFSLAPCEAIYSVDLTGLIEKDQGL